MSDKSLEEKATEHSLQFDNPVDRDWAKYSFIAGYKIAKEEMESRLKEADFIVKKISDHCFDEPDTYFACTFCDMGDSGHSSKGKGYHDDYCLAKISKDYLEKWK